MKVDPEEKPDWGSGVASGGGEKKPQREGHPEKTHQKKEGYHKKKRVKSGKYQPKPNKDLCDAYPDCRLYATKICVVCDAQFCDEHYLAFEQGEPGRHPSAPYTRGHHDN